MGCLPELIEKASQSLRRMAQKMKFIFSGDMCVGENTLQPASVGFVRYERTNPVRGGLCLCQKSGTATFSAD